MLQDRYELKHPWRRSAIAEPASLSQSKDRSRRSAAAWLLVAAAAACLYAACGPKRQPPAPAPAAPLQPLRQNLFVLLPDEGVQATAIVVRNSAGQAEIARPNHAVRVASSNLPPAAPFALSRAEIDRIFGPAISALPLPELSFVLEFDLNDESPTARSRALVPEILAAIRQRRSTAVSVTGHTDASGAGPANYQLGLKRAEWVAEALRGAGVDPAILFLSSHGEADPLYPAIEGKPDPRNRRVEVVIR